MTAPDGKHTLKSFDAALEDMLQGFLRMGIMVADNCVVATKAYVKADDKLALEAIKRDLDIDEAFESLRASCFDLLLRFQPLAKDLRLVMGIEHAVGDLERAGDHAKNIAKRVIAGSGDAIETGDARAVIDMAHIVSDAINASVAAMMAREAGHAKQVISGDTKVDAHCDALFNAAMVELKRNPDEAQKYVLQLFVAKALERIGDHATNIAEEVVFLTRGLPPPSATRIGKNFV